MSLASRLLLLVIALEALVGGVLVARRLGRVAPPQADWTLLDTVTADQLRSAIAACQTAEDWRNLGELYMAAGCLVESEACHRVACELAPEDALLARQWGFALERIALLDDANAQYQRAMALGTPDPDGCRYFIARNQLRADNPAEARRVLTEGQALAANRYELARLSLREGALTPAGEFHQSVAAEQPRTLQVHLLGYRLALARGDAREALASADRARYAPEKLTNPFDEEAERILQATQALGSNLYWQAGRDLINENRLTQAKRLLEDAGAIDRSSTIVELLAEIAVRRGKFDEALELFEEHQERNGPAARIVDRMGDVWAAAGDPAQAHACWLRAIELEAGLDLKATHHKLAASLAQSGDQVAAEKHLARGHYFVGRDLLQFGYADKAIAYFAAAVKHDPPLAQGWFYLGEARRLGGERRSAAAAYHACLRLDPNHGRAHASLALLEAN